MPKYYYRCDICQDEWSEWGSMTEVRHDCARCGSKHGFYKVPQAFTSNTVSHGTSTKKVGDETKKGIEDNRKILNNMKQEAQAVEFKVDD
tara:strand:- start:86 stop:355 length:270 start_codon:yes stop_codon:yes gene_type:complete